ncbi:MAG: tRNA preQ1(34) S-adenosylmethionine ribosyltransferase-isomerase QueA [Desulfobacterales bacterium]|nr:MAG: tRNA preQ1(34) S-adenosylmethionine ribosyltransferase-isomerase QueA [Desulfobacterales bacterium]UCD91253.1 MAG: tRNA preQ1(34) S-adenosylmethionine ribosyltransferase-isomerase QueA [Desulfobacterales bacterium]
MFSLDDYNYKIPTQLIAQTPVAQRDRSKLLFLRKATGELSHHAFHEIADFLSSSDILVINNTQVIPARLLGKKDTGGKVELLILNYPGEEKQQNGRCEMVCQCLIKTSKQPQIGTAFFFDHILKAEVIHISNGIYTVRFSYKRNFDRLLNQIGHVPLPPYIKRETGNNAFDDKASYQTVYASQKGAVAAPTAGLHFSKKLLKKIKKKGVTIVNVTLHVSYGTFLPVRVSDIREHKMHSEIYFISKASAELINRAKNRGSRILATGTTCVRALEYAADDKGYLNPGSGRCDLFIYPGYRFKNVDAMITNFHLPQSTLLMLVSAFAGRENILKSYQEAIQHRYRFFSYGDAMLIA